MWNSIRKAAAWVFSEPPTPRVAVSPPPTDGEHVLLHIAFGDRPRDNVGGLWLHQVSRPEDADDVVTLIHRRDLPVDGVVLWGVDTMPCGLEVRAQWLSRLAHRLAPIPLWLPGARRLPHSLRRLGCQVILDRGSYGNYSAREYGQ